MKNAGIIPLAVMAVVFACFAGSCGQSEEEKLKQQQDKIYEEIKARSIDFDEMRKKVFAFMEDWRDSQNNGDFAAYSKCYSDDFRGVKRVGKDRSEFDNEHWLKDRKSMFRKPMTVTLDNIQVKKPNEIITVELIQTWESANYKDKGPKTIRLVEKGGSFSIIYEEMLESIVMKNLDKLAEGLGDFHFVFEDNYVVLDAEPEESFFTSAAEAGEATLHGVKDGWEAYAYVTDRVPTELLTDMMKNLTGKMVNIYNNKGESEQTEIEGIYVLTALIPHFGQMQDWNNEDTDDEDIIKWIRDNAGTSGRYLVLKLAGHYLKDPMWASSKSADQIKMYGARPGSESLLASIKGRPKAEEEQGHSITVLRGEGLPDYVYEYLGGGNPCGGPYFESSFTMWKITENGLEVFDTTAGPADVYFDLNGNGIPDYIDIGGFGTYSFYLDGKLHTVMSFRFLDCGC